MTPTEEGMSAALTAADVEINRLKTELATTIERCAQVVETWPDRNAWGMAYPERIAAAIRALKDKP